MRDFVGTELLPSQVCVCTWVQSCCILVPESALLWIGHQPTTSQGEDLRSACTPGCASSSVTSGARPPALTSNHPNHPNQHTNQPQVKEKTHETIGVHTELYQLFSDKWRSLLGRCSSNYISDAKLGQLLKQWAGEDDKQENKGETEDMSKLLTVLNEVTEMGPRALECMHSNFKIRVSNPFFIAEDLDEEDLKTVLMECLEDALIVLPVVK